MGNLNNIDTYANRSELNRPVCIVSKYKIFYKTFKKKDIMFSVNTNWSSILKDEIFTSIYFCWNFSFWDPQGWLTRWRSDRTKRIFIRDICRLIVNNQAIVDSPTAKHATTPRTISILEKKERIYIYLTHLVIYKWFVLVFLEMKAPVLAMLLIKSYHHVGIILSWEYNRKIKDLFIDKF